MRAICPTQIDDADFAFYGTVIGGQKQQLPRDLRGIHLLDRQMGEALGKLYVAHYFPPEAKAKVQQLVANLLKAYEADIGTLTWMTPATRAEGAGEDPAFHAQGRLSRQVARLLGAHHRAGRAGARCDQHRGVRVEPRAEAHRQSGRPRRMGHDAADQQRLLQPDTQRDRLPGGHPAAALLRSRTRTTR